MSGIIIFAFLFIAFLIFIVNNVSGKRKTGSQATGENSPFIDNSTPFSDNPTYSMPDTSDHHAHHNYDSSENASSHDSYGSPDINYDNSSDSSSMSSDSATTSD